MKNKGNLQQSEMVLNRRKTMTLSQLKHHPVNH